MPAKQKQNKKEQGLQVERQQLVRMEHMLQEALQVPFLNVP
jgi:hypothetical protein